MPYIISLGSCGLHAVHDALKSGVQAITWNIASLLRSLFYLLQEAPYWTNVYAEWTGGAPLPKRFWAMRLLEDVLVTEQARSSWPSVQKYVTKLESDPKGAMAKIQSFSNVKNSVKDHLTTAWLHFCIPMQAALSILRPLSNRSTHDAIPSS